MKRLFAVILGVLTILALGGAVGYSIHRANATGGESPVITFKSEEIRVSANASNAELLAGVTASDKEDGDVTDSLMVERVSNLSDGAVTVTYAAFDSQGHVSRAARKAYYTDYTKPRFTMSRPMIFSATTVNDIMDGIGATDCIDGDITAYVRASYTDPKIALSATGEHDVELTVTNSVGDTVHLTIPVRVVSESPRSDQIPLSEYLVYLEKNSAFDAMSYLPEELRETATREEKNRLNMNISSNVDVTKPGVYAVDYETARDEQIIASTRLIVVVE